MPHVRLDIRIMLSVREVCEIRKNVRHVKQVKLALRRGRTATHEAAVVMTTRAAL